MEHSTAAGGTALVTGGTRRIGAAIARCLHRAGMNLALHHRSRPEEAEHLRRELEDRRPDSVLLLRADLRDTAALRPLVERAAGRWRRLDLLVNNAAGFYPTPLESATEAQWEDLVGSNLKAPYFLAQAAAPWLREAGGSIVNLADIHAQRPMGAHSIYCISKAGLEMLTKALARELAPEVRVNAVAPGAILWPESGASAALRRHVLERVPAGREGEPAEVARAVLYLARDAGYVTGQVLAVDGGRSLRT